MLAVCRREGAIVLGGEPNVGRSLGRALGCRIGKERVLVLCEELHRIDNAIQVAAWDGKVVGDGGADGEDGRVEAVDGTKDVFADLDARHKVDALLGHQIDAPLHRVLLELHVGDAIGEEAADLWRALKDGDGVAEPLVELVGRSEPGRARAHDGDLLARAAGWRLRLDPALLPCAVDDCILHILDRHRLVDQSGDARTFAWRRAHAARELGEVVGGRKVLVGLLPFVLEDVIVEFGDQVVDWAARVRLTERSAAVHASRRLPLGLLWRVWVGAVDLSVISQPLCGGPVGLWLALVLEEAPELGERAEGAVAPGNLA
mmetsp:Transcript_734/g.2591  ORF Transcript_734/g.2591 Transcript_734/m.2591 type:complete len:317 (-) Transcript_734:59-1009(-)